jgi:hypothetical protein
LEIEKGDGTMAITNYDSIILNRASGKDDDYFWFKSTSRTPGAAGQWYSLMQSAGYPGAMVWNTTKGTGALMQSTNAGAISIKAANNEDAYLLTGGVNVSAISGFSAIMLVDVVWGVKLDTSQSAGAITTPAWTRYTDGKGLQILCFGETATSAAVSPQITYNAPEGNGHACNITTPNPSVVAQCYPVLQPFGTLAAGDTGVTGISNISITSGTAGQMVIAVVKPLMVIPTVAAASYVERDSTSQIDGLIKLPRGSDNLFPCIGMMAFAGGTSACATQSGFIRKVNAVS